MEDFSMVMAVVFAYFYYRAAQIDDSPAWLWVLLSLVASFLGASMIGFGYVGIGIAQILLFVLITGFRIVAGIVKL